MFEDNEGEWLVVKYGSSTKQIQRQSADIKPHRDELQQRNTSKKSTFTARRKSVVEEKTRISEEKTDLSLTKPLQQFTSTDMSNKIKEWIYNDIDHKRFSLKTQDIFIGHELSGKTISIARHVRPIVQNDLLEFMSSDTLDIIFDHFHKEKNKNPSGIRRKSSQEIAELIYTYPINELLNWIQTNNINGTKFIRDPNSERMIKKITGWKEEEIYQIQAALFEHKSIDKREFVRNMHSIFKKNYGNKFSNEIVNKIQDAILEFDPTDIHYKINNSKNIDEFSFEISDMVDEITQIGTGIDQDIVKHAYDAIAECFTFNNQFLTNDYNRAVSWQHWICNNCGNRNVNSYINNKLNIDLSICS
eukprot:214151_1